jgi:radical SAM protein with 4Fe4S-binding SPASM domain
MRALGEGKNPIVKSVLMRENMRDIHGLIQFLGEMGVTRYFLLHEDVIGGSRLPRSLPFPDFMEYVSALRSEMIDIMDIGFVAASGFFKYGAEAQGRCDAGTKKLAILPDGSTFPCNLMLGFEEFLIGNVMKDSIDTMLGHPVIKALRGYSGNSCESLTCRYYRSCSGGCPAHSLLFSRDFRAIDPRCSHMHREGKENGNIEWNCCSHSGNAGTGACFL